MGLIRKKTATRGGEGGLKYVCDVCSADITSTVGLARTIFFKRDFDPCHPGPYPLRSPGMQRL